jgi:hypothetical protein
MPGPSAVTSSLCSVVRHVVALDKRSLALFRILLGCIIIGDLLDRLYDLEAHYTDDGLLPRQIALHHLYHIGWWSIHMAIGSFGGQLALFIVHATLAVLLIVGYRTQMMSICLWIMCCSLQARNIIVLHGGDTLLRLALFYCMFLPLGDCFAVDRLKHWSLVASKSTRQQQQQQQQQKQQQYLTVSLCSLCWMLQLAIMYWFNYINKDHASWTETGLAGYYALRLEYFRTWFGSLMLAITPMWLIALGTRAVLLLEGFGWLLFFVPWKTQHFRAFGMVLFILMHIAFGSCLALGMFSFITVSSLLSLTPSIIWDRILCTRQRNTTKALRMYLNEVDPLARTLAAIFDTFVLLPGTIQYASIDERKHWSQVAEPSSPVRQQQQQQQDSLSSSSLSSSSSSSSSTSSSTLPISCATPTNAGKLWIIVDGNEHESTSIQAICVVLSHSPLWFWLPLLIRVSLINRTLQRLLEWYLSVRHHYQSRWHRKLSKLHASATPPSLNGSLDSTPLPMFASGAGGRAQQLALMRASVARYCTRRNVALLAINVLVAWSIVFAVQWSYAWRSNFAFFPNHYWLGITLRLDQVWSMFAPHPPFADSYIRVIAMQTNEHFVDVMRNAGLRRWHGESVIRSKPDTYRYDVGSHRWAKFFESIVTHAEHEHIREAFAKYLCKQWNRRHTYESSTQLEVIEIFHISQASYLDGSHGPDVVSPLWFQLCYPVAPGATYDIVWKRLGAELDKMGGVPKLIA